MIARVAVVTGVGISLNLLSLQWVVTFLRLTPEVAQVFALVCSGCVNFAGNKAWTFRPVPVKAEA
jgi:putative flippase GtrA